MLEPGLPRPKVTILYLCENAADTIEASIHSVFKQTYVNWDLLIVDCNSSDASLRLAQVLSANGPKQPVRVLPYPSNDRKKIQFTLREHITGGYLFVLAQGDILHPVCLDELVKALEDNPKAPFAYSSYIPYDGFVGSSQYFEEPSVSPGPFNVASFLYEHKMPNSILFRRTNRFVQIDFEQKYWSTDFCLQHYFLGQEPCYVGVPLVNQPKIYSPEFSYFHMSRMVARNRQHYSENDVNWHSAVSDLWNDPDNNFTLVVAGDAALFRQKSVREFADQLSEQFRLAGHNYLYMAFGAKERELIAGVPLLPIDPENKASFGRKLREVGKKLYVLVLDDASLGYFLKASDAVLYSSLLVLNASISDSRALNCFDSVISNDKSETLTALAEGKDLVYDFGSEGKKVFIGKVLDYCQGQNVVLKSQQLALERQLKLVQNSLGKDTLEFAEGLDLSVVLLCHDHEAEKFSRVMRAWSYVEGHQKVEFCAAVYGESSNAADLFSAQGIKCEILPEGIRHSRARAANLAASKTSSEWLMFMDGQQLPAPYLLALVSHYCKQLRRVNCFYSKCTRMLPVQLPEQWAEETYYEWMHVGTCTWWHRCDGALIVKRSCLESLEGFSEGYQLWPYEFDDLLLRLECLGERPVELPRASVLMPWELSFLPGSAEQSNRLMLEDLMENPSVLARNNMPFQQSYQDLLAQFPPTIKREKEQSILKAANTSTNQAELLYETAQILKQQGNTYLAMDCLQHAVFMDPDESKFVFELAKIYLERSEIEAFQRCYDRLRYLNPKDERLELFESVM